MNPSFLKHLPLLCPGCGSDRYPALAGSFCPECLGQLNFFRPDFRCPGCGGENFSALECCSQCLEEPPRPWKNALALFAYRSYGKELLRRFKFNNAPELARPLGILAANLLLSSDLQPEILVPVPLTLPRFFRRSYNQSELLCRIISHCSSIPTVQHLKRRFFTLRHQALLDRRRRHQNLAREFSVSGSVRGKNLLLVDDILTTGATLTAAARTLLDAGAADVNILVIARSLDYTAKSHLFHQNSHPDELFPGL